MPSAWFVCGYRRRASSFLPARYCAMDDFTPEIRGVGGIWHEAEVLGNRALVKVRASDTLLNQIARTTGFLRLPDKSLTQSLADVPQAVLDAMRQMLLNAGYADSEISGALPNLASASFGDYLRFFASRRRKPRYDALSDTVFLDGPIQPVRPVDSVDRTVA